MAFVTSSPTISKFILVFDISTYLYLVYRITVCIASSCPEKLAAYLVTGISSLSIWWAACRDLWLDEFLYRGIGLQTRRQYWFGGLADQVVFPYGILFVSRGFYIELPVFLANPTNFWVNWIRQHLSWKVCTFLIIGPLLILDIGGYYDVSGMTIRNLLDEKYLLIWWNKLYS